MHTKFNPLLKNSLTNLWKVLTNKYIAICVTSCNKCRFLVDSHRNTSIHQKALGSRSENLIRLTSQTFLRSSDTDFVEKVTKAFLSADIPL